MIIFRDLLYFFLCVGVFTVELKNHYDYHTVEALIFKQCKNDYETLIINDESEKLGLTSLQQLHEQFNSVILHKQEYLYRREFPNIRKVDAILITTTSPEILTGILDNLRKRMWWDVMIPVYILNLPDNDCIIAMEFLQPMWNISIPISYFLCMENNEVQIYTYNPFTNRAPSNWIKMNVSDDEPQWTLYRRNYQPETVCQDLDFDRTKYLDGYPINAVAPTAPGIDSSFLGHYINYNHKHWNENIIVSRNHLVIDALTKNLNVSLRLYLITAGYSTAQVEYVARDISANLMFFNYYLDLKINTLSIQSYPLAWSESSIVTYNRGYQTLGEKIWNFYGLWTVMFTIFVLLVTFIVIWFIEKGRTAFAVFEIIRLLISHSLYTRMNSLSLRIFFLTILIYFLIVQATFNGHLAKFLTKPELRRHPETQEDLKDLGYTVFDSRHAKQYLATSDAETRSYHTKVKGCLNYILYNDSSVACVFNHYNFLEYLQSEQTKKLYVSDKLIESLYSTFYISKDWPLLNRVNMVIMFIDEMGFRPFTSSQLRYNITYKSIVAKARLNEDFHPIKLENLIFSFWILAVGLISAALSFCVEMRIFDESKLNVISHMKNIKKRIFKTTRRERDL